MISVGRRPDLLSFQASIPAHFSAVVDTQLRRSLRQCVDAPGEATDLSVCLIVLSGGRPALIMGELLAGDAEDDPATARRSKTVMCGTITCSIVAAVVVSL